MKKFINTYFQKLGYQINRYPNADFRRRLQFLKQYQINKIFDVGANFGQFAMSLRKFSYSGEIISFEPLSSAFKQLKVNSENYKNWKPNNCAIGNENKKAIINISSNSHSSSINDILEAHINAEQNSRYIGTEQVEMKTLDSIFNDFCSEGDRVALKIDTQGFEKNVIDGANNSLQKIILIQLEMSIIPLYKDEVLLPDMIKYLNERNFKLISIENGFSNPKTQHLLQVDGVFLNKRFL
jgi:FkbM family methyltransferase